MVGEADRDQWPCRSSSVVEHVGLDRRSVPNWGLVPTLIAAGRGPPPIDRGTPGPGPQRPTDQGYPFGVHRTPSEPASVGCRRRRRRRGWRCRRRCRGWQWGCQAGAAAAVAGDHHALDGMGRSRGGGRGGHVPGGQLGPDPRGGHHLVAGRLQGTATTSIPRGRPRPASRAGSPARLVAEAEVLADHHRPGARAVEQDRVPNARHRPPTARG